MLIVGYMTKMTKVRICIIDLLCYTTTMYITYTGNITATKHNSTALLVLHVTLFFQFNTTPDLYQGNVVLQGFVYRCKHCQVDFRQIQSVAAYLKAKHSLGTEFVAALQLSAQSLRLYVVSFGNRKTVSKEITVLS